MFIATSTFTASLAVAAPIITVFQALAQTARIRAIGAKGVSLGTWLLSTLVAQIWLCYGFVFHVPAEIYANGPCLIVATIVVFFAAKSQGRMGAGILGYVSLTAITIAATTAGMFHDFRWLMATVAVGSSFVNYVPQLRLVIRPKDLSGVSAISWATACVTALAWLIYGFLIHQLAVALPSFVMLPAAIIILIQVKRHRIKNDSKYGLQAPIVE